MTRVGIVLGGIALAAALAACGERAQTNTGARKTDAPAFQGTNGSAYVSQGWKAGDQSSWEQQLRTRTQGGQNEYSRTAVKQ